jgi:hypothetical protein
MKKVAGGLLMVVSILLGIGGITRIYASCSEMGNKVLPGEAAAALVLSGLMGFLLIALAHFCWRKGKRLISPVERVNMPADRDSAQGPPAKHS